MQTQVQMRVWIFNNLQVLCSCSACGGPLAFRRPDTCYCRVDSPGPGFLPAYTRINPFKIGLFQIGSTLHQCIEHSFGFPPCDPTRSSDGYGFPLTLIQTWTYFGTSKSNNCFAGGKRSVTARNLIRGQQLLSTKIWKPRQTLSRRPQSSM